MASRPSSAPATPGTRGGSAAAAGFGGDGSDDHRPGGYESPGRRSSDGPPSWDGGGGGLEDDISYDDDEDRSPSAMRSFSGGASSLDESGRNFKVVIRVRPPLPRELHGDRPFQEDVKVDPSERMLVISENLSALEDGAMTAGPYSTHAFTFDHVYDQNCDQRKVYETTAKSVVESSLKGYNATIFAYGQTGTGKTYTMEGFNSAEERGIIPRAIEQIFRHIQSSVSPRMRFLVRASYLQIYNEVISDLLKPERSNLLIREDKKKGVFVEGLSEWVVRSPAEIYGLMERGGATRATASTKMNEISSRSHAVFIVIVEQSETQYLDEHGAEVSVEEFHRLVKARAGATPGGAGAGGEAASAGLKQLEANVRQSFKVGKLNLVDLAGSERVRLTGATGQRLEESKKINQSLSALGNVIASLTEGRPHIPYRDSKLTRILEDSLGGNCKTTMMAMISPALEAFSESLSTLKFANRAKNIKNEARVNEDLDQKSMLRRYERELKRLRAELEERSRNVVDQRRLLELDEQRRRAEEDKMAAIRALEARSREFMKEKQEKKRLEERIQLLQGQIMMGGAMALNNLADMPAFRNALKEHQERIRAEYETRLAELEKEREGIEEEKAQVDRYKQLLLKQRDIMILLTQRLNERDEQIVALQDELDAYDRHQREFEERLDEKTAALIHLQRVTMEHNAASPVKSSELVEALGDWAGRAAAAGGGGAAADAAAVAGGLVSAGRVAGAAIRAAGGDGAAPANGAVPAHLLLTTRQFRAYEDPAAARAAASTPPVVLDATGNPAAVTTLLAGGDRSASPPTPAAGGGGAAAGSQQLPSPPLPPPQQLLTAEEKIFELQRVVDGVRGDRERLARELEDVQAEKVSMEFLLREKLERLVQSEIEARLAVYRRQDGGGGGSGDAAAAAGAAAGSGGGRERELAAAALAHDRELTAARQEVQRLRAQVAAATTGAAAGTGGDDAQQQRQQVLLSERVEAHEKERRAIQTIMEHKVKALADAVAGAAATVMQASAAAASGGGGGGAGADAAARLLREAHALQRLVNASVAAMRNSELSASGSTGTSGGGGATASAAPPAAAPSGLGTPAATPLRPSSASAGSGGLPPSHHGPSSHHHHHHHALPPASSGAFTPSGSLPPPSVHRGEGAAALSASLPQQQQQPAASLLSIDALIAQRKEELLKRNARR